MKYFLYTILIVSVSQKSFSATRLQFFIGDRNAMVILTPADAFGNSDSDSSDLYAAMDVPEQDTMLGKGKSITSPDRDFNLVCGEYKSQCQIILNQSRNVIIKGAQKKMHFKVVGDLAAQLTRQFKIDPTGKFEFITTDQLLKFSGNAGEFTLDASFNR